MCKLGKIQLITDKYIWADNQEPFSQEAKGTQNLRWVKVMVFTKICRILVGTVTFLNHPLIFSEYCTFWDTALTLCQMVETQKCR